MPIRRSPAKRSRLASASATTRVMMRPTVAQATPSSSPTACLEVWTASQAAVSSKARVWPAPWRAQGTAATTTPCSEQQTLGASASRSAPTTPRSNARQRRRPWPWSKPGQRRPHRPQRRLTPLRGRTDTTSACSSWSKQTRSTTACSTPTSLAHSLADRTPFPFFRIQPSESRNRRRATACSHIRPSRHPRIGEKSPFSAGGPTDTVTRLIAEPMSKKLGTQIVVQNVEGAGGTVAAGEVAQARPDGYTVLMHHIGMSTAPALYADLPYKPLEDFKTIGLVTEVPMTLIARRDFQPNTLQELVAYVKANADKVTYANAGIGAASHLCGLLFQKAIGVKLQEVPYEGTGPALTDIVGGQVDFMCDQTTNTTGQIKSREVKAYAVTTPERVESLPDLPTAKEAGLTDLELSVWHGLYVPADTPDEVVGTLSDALKVALADQGVIDKLAELGTAPVAADRATPEAHRQQLEEQLGVWGPIIEEAGVKAS